MNGLFRKASPLLVSFGILGTGLSNLWAAGTQTLTLSGVVSRRQSVRIQSSLDRAPAAMSRSTFDSAELEIARVFVVNNSNEQLLVSVSSQNGGTLEGAGSTPYTLLFDSTAVDLSGSAATALPNATGSKSRGHVLKIRVPPNALESLASGRAQDTIIFSVAAN